MAKHSATSALAQFPNRGIPHSLPTTPQHCGSACPRWLRHPQGLLTTACTSIYRCLLDIGHDKGSQRDCDLPKMAKVMGQSAAYEPHYTQDIYVPSSADAEYLGREITLYGRPVFEGISSTQVTTCPTRALAGAHGTVHCICSGHHTLG